MNDRLVQEWERALAAEGVSLTTEELIAALRNPHLNVRTGAAIILGRRGEAAALPHLKQLLTDKLIVRVEAAMSLILLGDRSGIPVLIEILDGDLLTGAPITAARYLAVLGDPRGYRLVLKELRSKFTGNRLMAAVTLKSFIAFQGKEICGHKVDLFTVAEKSLKDPDSLVRRQLLYVLALLDDPRSNITISTVSRSDRDESVRRIAQQLLSTLSTTRKF